MESRTVYRASNNQSNCTPGSPKTTSTFSATSERTSACAPLSRSTAIRRSVAQTCCVVAGARIATLAPQEQLISYGEVVLKETETFNRLKIVLHQVRPRPLRCARQEE